MMLEGKVAGVLNTRELAINIGSEHGVTMNMRFKVLAAEDFEILDPDTNKVLGVLNQEKVRVKAVEVKEIFSICRTYKTKTVGSYPGIGRMFELSPIQKIPETLKAEDSTYPPPLSEEESYVKSGDRVIQIEHVED